jgi:hypothetical protein
VIELPNEVLAADPPYQRGGLAVAALLTLRSAHSAVLPFGGRLKLGVSWITVIHSTEEGPRSWQPGGSPEGGESTVAQLKWRPPARRAA